MRKRVFAMPGADWHFLALLIASRELIVVGD
jgi:hypothetical protein